MSNNLNEHIGKMIILPSTFIESRNMMQNYQDAMVIVSKFDKPDLFITMTCNPKWREISYLVNIFLIDLIFVLVFLTLKKFI